MQKCLHKNILIQKNNNNLNTNTFFIHGDLMGWTDGVDLLYHIDAKSFIKKKIEEKDIKAIEVFMRGVVGSCFIEICINNEVFLFASSASSGFYWYNEKINSEIKKNYLVSNYEGKFFRQVLKNGKKPSEGAIMNSIFSHQSVIRPPFKGFIEETKRCQPGFFVKFSSEECSMKSFIIEGKSKSRIQQDNLLRKKFNHISKIYSIYIKKNNFKAHVAFSGGVDSTFLLLNFKNSLVNTSHGYYKKRDKIPELKIAKEIANLTESKINFVEPYENFSNLEVKNRALVGLSTLNGIHYMKHNFQSNPYSFSNSQDRFILTGQNSDTLFHIDTFAASSFTTGIMRFIKMSSGIILRFKTTMFYYRILLLFGALTKKHTIPNNVKKTFLNLSEHGSNDLNLSPNVHKVLTDYKIQNYIIPFEKWLINEFYPKLLDKQFSKIEKVNYAARFARWLRTIGNFHQQYQNISYFENVKICTPFSEGPIASELLTYKLGFKDVFIPKIFLHRFIKHNLGISYDSIRKKVLGGEYYYFPVEIFKLGKKVLIKIFKKLKNNINIRSPRPDSIINKQDLYNLREVIGHKNGSIDRLLLKYINNDDCKKYLNYLYDCIELKNDPTKLNKVIGMRLCRLVNLHIMMMDSKRELNI